MSIEDSQAHATFTSASNGLRRETGDEECSMQNNEPVDASPSDETMQRSDNFDPSDVFLGAGICRTPPPVTGSQAHRRLISNPTANWRSEPASSPVGALSSAIANSQATMNTEFLPDQENSDLGRMRQMSSGMVPIAEEMVQINGFHVNQVPPSLRGGDVSAAWPSAPVSDAIGFQDEDLLYEMPLLPLRKVISSMNSSSVCDFPQTPVWNRDDDGTIASILKQEAQYSQLKHRLHFPNSVGGSSIMDAFSSAENGLFMHSSASIMGRHAGHCSVNTSWQNKNKRDEILRLSQNPWGPNTVLGTHPLASDQTSVQRKNVSHTEGTVPFHFVQSSMTAPVHTVYSKYRSRPGFLPRFRRRLFSFGGRICRNFFVWLLIVATVAGIKGFQENSDNTLLDNHKTENSHENRMWSDSDSENENEHEHEQQLSPNNTCHLTGISFKG